MLFKNYLQFWKDNSSSFRQLTQILIGWSLLGMFEFKQIPFGSNSFSSFWGGMVSTLAENKNSAT